jgi:cyclin B
MVIEVEDSNQLKYSSSTQASNNNNNNNSSLIESKNLNLNNCSNICYIPSENQSQIQFTIPPSQENEIFKFDFKSQEEFVTYSGEYLNEMYANLLLDEQNMKFKPKLGYMQIQKDINEQMRAILMDWLVEVHYRFRLKSETLYQTVWIIDAYLSLYPIIRARLQLLGIAALLISCKVQEIYYPQLNELIDITDGAYIKEELTQMEAHILKVLNFNIMAPNVNEFYNIIAKAFNFDKSQYYFGKYFMESSLIDYQMIKFPASVIAASCAYIVMKFFGIHNYKSLYSNSVIKESCPQKVIKEATREICNLVKNLSQSTLKAVKDKYSLPQFLNVSQYCDQK